MRLVEVRSNGTPKDDFVAFVQFKLAFTTDGGKEGEIEFKDWAIRMMAPKDGGEKRPRLMPPSRKGSDDKWYSYHWCQGPGWYDIADEVIAQVTGGGGSARPSNTRGGSAPAKEVASAAAPPARGAGGAGGPWGAKRSGLGAIK